MIAPAHIRFCFSLRVIFTGIRVSRFVAIGRVLTVLPFPVDIPVTSCVAPYRHSDPFLPLVSLMPSASLGRSRKSPMHWEVERILVAVQLVVSVD